MILKDTSGHDIDPEIFRNKYVLMNFWASWCKPCRASNAELKVLYDKYRGKGFEIVGISIDEQKLPWKKAIVQDGMKWPQLNDEKGVQGTLCKYYDITGVPVKILLDNLGQIVGFDLSVDEIQKILGKGLAN